MLGARVTEKHVAPAIFRWSFFPIVMGTSIAWCIYRMANGVSPPEAILIPQLIAFTVVAVFEHIYPYHRSWNRSRA